MTMIMKWTQTILIFLWYMRGINYEAAAEAFVQLGM
jgi:hypothetical protein